MKQFNLGAKKYRIRYRENLDRNDLGYSNSVTGNIDVRTTFNGEKVPLDSQEQTIFHEITHAILDELAYNKLSDDEVFVQGFSTLMYQVFKTLK